MCKANSLKKLIYRGYRKLIFFAGTCMCIKCRWTKNIWQTYSLFTCILYNFKNYLQVFTWSTVSWLKNFLKWNMNYRCLFPNTQESTVHRPSRLLLFFNSGKKITPVLFWTSSRVTWNSFKEFLFSIGSLGTIKQPMAIGFLSASTRMTLYRWVGTATSFCPIT